MFSILDPNRSLFLEARPAKRLPNVYLATAILILAVMLSFGSVTVAEAVRGGDEVVQVLFGTPYGFTAPFVLCIAFGMRVSGHEVWGGTLLDLEAAGPSVLSGGDYGPEASLFGTLVFLAGTALVLARPFRREFHRSAG